MRDVTVEPCPSKQCHQHDDPPQKCSNKCSVVIAVTQATRFMRAFEIFSLAVHVADRDDGEPPVGQSSDNLRGPANPGLQLLIPATFCEKCRLLGQQSLATVGLPVPDVCLPGANTADAEPDRLAVREFSARSEEIQSRPAASDFQEDSRQQADSASLIVDQVPARVALCNRVFDGQPDQTPSFSSEYRSRLPLLAKPRLIM